MFVKYLKANLHYDRQQAKQKIAKLNSADGRVWPL